MTTPLDRLLLDALLHPDAQLAASAAKDYLAQVDVQVLPWAHTRLFPTLYRRMSAAGMPLPALLKGTYRRAWTSNQARFRAAATAMAQLEAAGIRTLVLKGASLVPAYGGDWGVRDMADVDLLVDVGNAERAAALLEADGWRAGYSTTAAAAMARYLHRRHSWGFERADGASVDLHWHVLQSSRGPASDRSFFDAAVPLELSNVRAARLCDADLLLHVLEHASHGEGPAELLWIVDVVQLLRSVDDVDALAGRFAAQAREHDLVATADEHLARVGAVSPEPAIARLRAGLGAPGRTPAPSSLRGRLREYRHGGTPWPAAVRALAANEIDAPLAARRRAWIAYAALGRQPRIDRWLARRGPLAGAPTPHPPATDAEGWWEMWTAEAVDAMCGPGWSFPEPLAEGVWTDGSEARLLVPVGAAATAATVGLELSVLGRHGGPPRSVTFRIDGQTRATVHATAHDTAHTVVLTRLPVRAGVVDLSLRLRGAARPVDLGIGPDTRRLAVHLRRVRVHPLALD